MGHNAHIDRPIAIVLFISLYFFLQVFELQDLSKKCIELSQTLRQISLILQPIQYERNHQFLYSCK